MKFKIDIQPVITPNITVTIFTFLLSLAGWFGFSFLHNQHQLMTGFIGSIAETILPSASLTARFISFTLMVLCALFIAQMNNKYAFITTRTFLPTFIFVSLSTFWVSTHGNYLSYIAVLLVLFSLHIILETYRNNRATEPAFLGLFVFAIAAAIIPELVFLIPFYWIGMAELKGLSLRTFFASVIGFIAPWVVLYASFFLVKGDFNSLPNIPTIISQYSFYSFRSYPVILYLALLVIILLICIYGMMQKMNFENIKVRKYLSLFRHIGFGLLLISIFRYSNINSYSPLIAFFYALICGYTFTFNRNLFHSILFLLLIISSLLISVYTSLFVNL